MIENRSVGTATTTKSMNKNTVIVLSGATSVGKSSVAFELCKRINAEIVVADSVQVYKHMNIGSNKATPEEMAAVPHHLVDVHDTAMVLNAGEFAAMAAEKIQDILKRGKTPIVVGGSLMWVNWLVSGIPDAPLPSAGVVQRAQELLQEAESVQNWSMGLDVLKEYDPLREKIPHANDWYRLRRYLEIALSMKENRSSADNGTVEVVSGARRHLLPEADIRHFFVTEHRDSLYRTIDERCEIMLSSGLLQEVADLLLRDILSPDLIVSRSIGYRQTIDYLLREDYQPGDMHAYELYLMDFATATRNYARQQISYHRKGDTSLFIRMHRLLNPNRSAFLRSDKKDLWVKRPPPMIPVVDAVDRLADEVLHWCTTPLYEYEDRVRTQKDQGLTYGKLMSKNYLPRSYSIENSPDGDPKFVRYMLARMVRARLLKLPSKETDEWLSESWLSNLMNEENGVTPDTVEDLQHEWTAEEIDIRSVEANSDLMKTYVPQFTRRHLFEKQVKLADELRAMLFEKRPDVVESFQKQFTAGVSTVSRKVAVTP